MGCDGSTGCLGHSGDVRFVHIRLIQNHKKYQI